MTEVRIKRFVAAVVAGSMMLGSTAAIAGPSTALPTQISPWAALTGLTAGAPAATLCGTAAAAAAAGQAPAGGCVLPAVDAPPPVAVAPPPPEPPMPAMAALPSATGVGPLFYALAALTTGTLIYFAVRNDHHTVSPA